MSSLEVHVNAATVTAMVLGELMSWFWFSEDAPWGEHSSDRHFITATLGTCGLALLIHWIMHRFWPVRRLQDAAKLGAVLAGAYFCLEVPHIYPGPVSLTHFVVHVAHKFCLVFLMASVIWGYRKYVEKRH